MENDRYTAAVITVSDQGASRQREDTSGPAVADFLTNNNWRVVYKVVVPDELEVIKSELVKCSDELSVALVLTTGGTGFSQRDITPEATREVIEREAQGLSEAMRHEGFKITPRAIMSRGVSGIRKKTLIVNLPGSRKAALESVSFIESVLHHGIDMLLETGSSHH